MTKFDGKEKKVVDPYSALMEKSTNTGHTEKLNGQAFDEDERRTGSVAATEYMSGGENKKGFAEDSIEFGE